MRTRNPSFNLRSARGAIDLASIMVGVLVIGLIAGVISATVFAVIPWAQDRTAQGNLTSVATAEAVSKAKDGRYLDSVDLDDAGYLPASSNVAVRVNDDRSCYSAFSKSASGAVFYRTSRTGVAAAPAVWPSTRPDGFPAGCVWPVSVDAAVSQRITNVLTGAMQNTWSTNPGTSFTPGVNADGFTWSRFTQGSSVTSMIRAHADLNTLEDSETYTASVWLHNDSATPISIGLDWSDKDVSWTTVPAGESRRASVTGSRSTYDATYRFLDINVVDPGRNILIRDVMATKGSTVHDFANGNTPGWAWAGAAGASSSTGYPYTLDSVAGAPMVNVRTETESRISGDPLDGFAHYTVYNAKAPVAEWTSLVFFGSNAVDWYRGGFQFQRRGGDPTTGHVRIGTSANFNQDGTPVTDSTAWTKGRHIVVHTAPAGLTSMTTMTDGRPDISRDIVPGTGIPRELHKTRVAVSSVTGLPSTESTLLQTVYYPTSHDRATREAVTAWLSNHHGVRAS